MYQFNRKEYEERGTRMPVLECLSTGDYILSLQEASGYEV